MFRGFRAAGASARSAFRAAATPRTLSAAGAALALGAAAGNTAHAWSWPWEPAAEGLVHGGVDYVKVARDIAAVLDELDYDDGSYGPVFVRLAWHAAGTFSAKDGTGGSDGATMRFKAESSWGANAGLGVARARLERVKAAHPGLSTADLWSLAGVVAIQEMGGPAIPWRPGRSDAPDASKTVPDGRLPDASKGAQHLRDVFGRMGFTDRDIVALSGAHALGRCHPDRSGFSGPWTFSPTTFSNDYFKLLLSETWVPKKWAGPPQFEDAKTKSLMMLPSDLALVKDAELKALVEAYAADKALFFKDFAAAFAKLQELGVKAFAAPGAVKPAVIKLASK